MAGAPVEGEPAAEPSKLREIEADAEMQGGKFGKRSVREGEGRQAESGNE